MDNISDTYLDELFKSAGFNENSYESCMNEISDKVFRGLDVDWSDIVAKYNIQISKETLRKAASPPLFGGAFAYEYFKNKNVTKGETKPLNKYPEETSINKDGSYTSSRIIEISKDDLKNKNTLLKAHGFDIREWELISARSNLWNAYSKADGIQELYSSKIIVKPRADISLEEITDYYKELLNTYSPPEIKQYHKVQGGKMLCVPIVDLHLGKFSTADIVGENNYNSQSARDGFNYVIDNIIEKVKGENIEKVLFPIGNDFFNYDKVDNSTTRGTPQDVDQRHQSLFKDGVLLLIDGISKLSKELHTVVEVFYVGGNHDMMSSYHALMSIWCYFANNENVIVDTSASPRHYIEFGKSLLGFSHGDKEKNRISGIMQVEAREAWGRTRYHRWYLGHLHSQHGKEENGVIIEHLSSITGADAWHHESGFVGAERKCTCDLWDKEYGLDTRYNIVIK